MALTAQTDSRIADASRVWQAVCNTDVTDWDKANEFIVACFALADSVNPDSDCKLQWRRVGGTFADVGADTEICWGTSTVLVDPKVFAVDLSAGCCTPWDYGIENEGDNLCYLSNIANGDYGECQFALGFGSGALTGQGYELKLVVIDWSSEAILQTTITTATGAVIEWLAGVSNGVAQVTGDTKIGKKIVSIVSCVASVSGAAKILKKISGSSTGIASVSGVVKVNKKVAGAIVSIASVSGSLTVIAIKLLAGVVSGVASVSGAIKVSKRVTGTVVGVASVDGTAKIVKKMAGAVAGVAGVSGGIKVLKEIVGSIAGVASVAGSLTVTAGEVIEWLAGVVNGAASVTGAIKCSKPIAGLSAGIASVSGLVKVTHKLAGAITGIATIVGTLTEEVLRILKIFTNTTTSQDLNINSIIRKNVTLTSTFGKALKVTMGLKGG